MTRFLGLLSSLLFSLPASAATFQVDVSGFLVSDRINGFYQVDADGTRTGESISILDPRLPFEWTEWSTSRFFDPLATEGSMLVVIDPEFIGQSLYFSENVPRFRNCTGILLGFCQNSVPEFGLFDTTRIEVSNSFGTGGAPDALAYLSFDLSSDGSVGSYFFTTNLAPPLYFWEDNGTEYGFSGGTYNGMTYRLDSYSITAVPLPASALFLLASVLALGRFRSTRTKTVAC